MTHNLVVRLLSILAVILVPIIACGESGSSTASEEIRSTPSVTEIPEEPPTPMPEDPPIEEISAAALDSFYEENELAGDEKYKGRMLIVNGIVYSIESSFVSLEGEGMMDVSGVYCHYNSSQYSAVAKLREGQRIRIKGLVRGQDFMGGVDIEDCVILDHEPLSMSTPSVTEIPEDPPIEEISAAALDSFYEENERAGDEKYKGRMLIVNGIVYSIESSFVSLEGEGMMDVSGIYCHYNSSQYSAVAQLREGHRIRIQGVVRGQDFMGGVDIEDCVILSSSYSNNTQDTKSDFERELDELETLQKNFERELDEEIDKLEEEWEEAMNELDNELDDIFDDF